MCIFLIYIFFLDSNNQGDQSKSKNDLTDNMLLSFLDDFLSGSLPPTIVSEELESDEETKFEFIPMHKVVASNFDKLYVFILFFKFLYLKNIIIENINMNRVVNTYQHFLLFVIAPW